MKKILFRIIPILVTGFLFWESAYDACPDVPQNSVESNHTPDSESFYYEQAEPAYESDIPQVFATVTSVRHQTVTQRKRSEQRVNLDVNKTASLVNTQIVNAYKHKALAIFSYIQIPSRRLIQLRHLII